MCRFNPINYQTAMLGGHAARRHGWVSPAVEAQVARLIETDAWFVGVAEHRELSLCAIARRLSPQSKHPCSRNLKMMRTVPEAAKSAANERVSLTGAGLAKLGSVTRADHITYALALSRFQSDAAAEYLAHHLL